MMTDGGNNRSSYGDGNEKVDHSKVKVPDNHKLVPMTPTQGMIDAGGRQALDDILE
ncbi:hypothetical protein [Serratia sp. DD3]|uniref:hypothetical protein n=1 Tax=Serratia sp. DD3 TaxID=1410619 RepID=UPI0003C5270A|nr:hypothetical protein [Serratia sp. DD3]KEY58483.1 hypothetical protein SRDD_27300 [Serratia sp. DD3]